MDMFSFNNLTKELEINEPEIFLVKEFKALLDRDKTKTKSRAMRELAYIYLAIDWKSPYNQYSEQERHEEALSDAGITEEEFNDPIFREACRKYRRLQDSNLSIQMLNAAKQGAEQFIEFFTEIADLNERDANGKPVFDAKKHFETMSQMHKLHDELKLMEDKVKKELSEQSTTRAGVEEGYDPGDI